VDNSPTIAAGDGAIRAASDLFDTPSNGNNLSREKRERERYGADTES
jgi:hypothetical protein